MEDLEGLAPFSEVAPSAWTASFPRAHQKGAGLPLETEGAPQLLRRQGKKSPSRFYAPPIFWGLLCQTIKQSPPTHAGAGLGLPGHPLLSVQAQACHLCAQTGLERAENPGPGTGPRCGLSQSWLTWCGGARVGSLQGRGAPATVKQDPWQESLCTGGPHSWPASGGSCRARGAGRSSEPGTGLPPSAALGPTSQGLAFFCKVP